MKIARTKSHFSESSFIDFDVLLLLSYCNLYVLQNYFDCSLELGFSQVDSFWPKIIWIAAKKKILPTQFFSPFTLNFSQKPFFLEAVQGYHLVKPRSLPDLGHWVIFLGSPARSSTTLITGTICSCLFAKHPLLLHSLFRFKDHPTLNKRYLLLNLLGKGGFSEVYKVNYEVMNIWKSYMRTSGWRIIWKKIIAVIDTTFTAAKRKPEKNSGLFGIRTLELRDTGAALLTVELTS